MAKRDSLLPDGQVASTVEEGEEDTPRLLRILPLPTNAAVLSHGPKRLQNVSSAGSERHRCQARGAHRTPQMSVVDPVDNKAMAVNVGHKVSSYGVVEAHSPVDLAELSPDARPLVQVKNVDELLQNFIWHTCAASASSQNGQHVPAFLLLAMFSLAAQYSLRTSVPPPDDGSMWNAGDECMEDAKIIGDHMYLASQLRTCQALLLFGYREVGIGVMARCGFYVGMAIWVA
ncbi:hypothetical protein LXA43DRAFT_1098128 [Ganoderma leucocontextum]|nr:hypothetical protein LXA43DRAFT_1098128 [Ganoderma leucocontextum]